MRTANFSTTTTSSTTTVAMATMEATRALTDADTTTATVGQCGKILSYFTRTSSDWTVCFLRSGSIYDDTKCSDLLVSPNLNGYTNANQFDENGVVYGCASFPNNLTLSNIARTCRNGIGHDIKLSDCQTCPFMIVCIKYS